MDENSKLLTYDRRAILRGIALLQAMLIVVVVVPEVPPLLRLPIVVAHLTIVPGLLLLSLFGINGHAFATKAVYMVGISLSFVMAMGAAISLFYPLIGIERPLAPIPLVTTILVVISALSALVIQRDVSLSVTIPVHSLLSPVPLALLLLPFVSILGTVYYHTVGSNIVLVGMLVLIALVPLVLVGVNRFNDEEFRWYALATWTISLALLYHGGSLLPPYFGAVKAGHLTIQQGIWLPNAQGLGGVLPNVVLYPIYAILSGVSMALETTLVNPFLVSVLPVILFELFRRYTSRLYAFLSCCIFMFSFPYYVLYPVGGRVASPVLFLALMGLALSDRSLSPSVRSGVGLIFSTGAAVSHYGTAWVAMFALLGAFVFYHALGIWDWFRELDSSPSIFSNLLHRLVIIAPSIPSRYLQQAESRDDQGVFPSLSFVGVYSVVAIAWYIYTSKGVKFTQLAIKIADAVRGILYTELGGSAANVATKQYGSQIVATSRLLYILFGVLLATGVAVAVYKRVMRDISLVDDEFLAFGVGFTAMIVGSMLPSGRGFAIARVMMIVFIFTLPFTLVGTDALVSIIKSFGERVSPALGIGLPTPSAVIAVMLAAFLVLNTGVVAAMAQDGFSPSRKLGQERLANSDDPLERGQTDACTQCNIEAHVWIMKHNESNRTVYADEFVQSQTDFYHPALVPQVPFNPQPPYYQPVVSLNNSTFERNYVLLIARNLDTKGVYKTKYEWISFNNLQIRFEQSNQIYDSGFARVHSGNEN